MTRGPAPSDRRVFLTLTTTRWLPVGLIAGMPGLLALERGLSVQETLTFAAAQGAVVVLLELPTSGFSDAFGRRPILIAAAAVNVVAIVAFVVAPSFLGFAVAAALMGLYRALDSGPLEAWYVDRVQARDPGAADRDALAADLARQNTLVGSAIAAGALAAGGLILWHPWPGSALLGPMMGALALALLHLGATFLLLPSEGMGGGTWSRAAHSVRRTPGVIAEGLRLLRRSRVLGALIAVEVFWGAAVVAVEQMAPLRLAELLGSEARAGAWAAPAAAAAWGAYALGAALAGWLALRLGTVPVAMLARVLHGAGAVVMGLAHGPGGLVAALLGGMGAHGLANPPHAALLHREAVGGMRATVLSLNSLAFMGCVAGAAPVLGLLAGHWSTPAAMIAGGVWSVLGALFYLPAWRRERGDRPG